MEQRTLGEIIRIRRIQLGLSQEELEWISGVSISTIYRIEKNKKRAGFETIEKLERALGIKLLDKQFISKSPDQFDL